MGLSIAMVYLQVTVAISLLINITQLVAGAGVQLHGELDKAKWITNVVGISS